jgi:ribosomal protein S18 acetylase RimI-like enzyme
MTIADLQVRRAVTGDAAALAELAARTFVDAFGAENNPEDLALYLAEAYGEPQQRAEIEQPDGITLLAELDGALAGYAQLRRSPAEWGNVELARFYVDRRWHGRGVAQSLMDAVLNAARTLGGTTLWLGVWERNPRGIAFYRKCGFTDIGAHEFVVGTDVQTDRVMTIEL